MQSFNSYSHFVGCLVGTAETFFFCFTAPVNDRFSILLAYTTESPNKSIKLRSLSSAEPWQVFHIKRAKHAIDTCKHMTRRNMLFRSRNRFLYFEEHIMACNVNNIYCLIKWKEKTMLFLSVSTFICKKVSISCSQLFYSSTWVTVYLFIYFNCSLFV